MNGYGEFYWKDGKIYVGHYINDKKHGFGIYYWPATEKIYIGMWKDAKQDGVGKQFNLKKNKAKYGIWLAGKRIRKFEDPLTTIAALDLENLVYQRFYQRDSQETLSFLNRGKALN